MALAMCSRLLVLAAIARFSLARSDNDMPLSLFGVHGPVATDDCDAVDAWVAALERAGDVLVEELGPTLEGILNGDGASVW